MIRKSNVTIEDVAKACGVSRQTVSRVINKGPNVKQAVRDKVEAAIVDLGYVPNLSARRMGGGRSFLILAINDRERTIENWRAGRGNDWVDQMLYGGMTECEAQGYHMVFELIDTDPEKAPIQLGQAIASLRPDGIILTPPHSDNDALAEFLSDQGIPVARVGRRKGDACIDVFMDEAGAAEEATRHLVELGHRRIMFLAGSPEYGNSRKRVEAFGQTLRELGLDDSCVHKANFQFDEAVPILERVLQGDDRPTAIIADNDAMAFAALHVANRIGLAVPSELSVVSFEDTPGVRFSVPPLTAIRQPTAEMIGKACDRLIAAAAGGEKAGRYELPYELIRRDTTGPAAG